MKVASVSQKCAILRRRFGGEKLERRWSEIGGGETGVRGKT